VELLLGDERFVVELERYRSGENVQRDLLRQAFLFSGVQMLLGVVVNLIWTHFISILSMEGLLHWKLIIGEVVASIRFFWTSTLVKPQPINVEVSGFNLPSISLPARGPEHFS